MAAHTLIHQEKTSTGPDREKGEYGFIGRMPLCCARQSAEIQGGCLY